MFESGAHLKSIKIFYKIDWAINHFVFLARPKNHCKFVKK